MSGRAFSGPVGGLGDFVEACSILSVVDELGDRITLILGDRAFLERSVVVRECGRRNDR